MMCVCVRVWVGGGWRDGGGDRQVTSNLVLDMVLMERCQKAPSILALPAVKC
jgi:hypothetical protein